MGACQPGDPASKYIDLKLSEEARKQRRTNKILFLGPGGSGKSTIFKQLQWLHLDGFSYLDAVELKQDIYFQIIHQMKEVIKYYEHAHDNDEKRSHHHDILLKDAISLVKRFDDKTVFHLEQLNDTLVEAIHYIWNHDITIHNSFNDYDLLSTQILDDSTQHFWNDLDRIREQTYVPTETDILSVRCRTTGIVEKEFLIKTAQFHIYDVGGQKSERRKWIRCFNDVQAVLFVISLECYNMLMCENLSVNCMEDSLDLFDKTVNNECFVKTHIILFLNKRDLFEKKILEVPITLCPAFDDFNEFDLGEKFNGDPNNPHDFEQTAFYIQHKFHALKRMKSKQMFVHLTNAMDRKNIDRVFNDVKHIVVADNLAGSAIY